MTTWHVRESTAHSGSRDGTTYALAWGTFSEITWGSGGVIAGDTLYVEGTHATVLAISVSGSDGALVTIRGDWPEEAGSIAGAGAIAQCVTATSYDYLRILHLACSGSSTGQLIQLYDGTGNGTDARYITIEECTLNDANGGTTDNHGVQGWGTNITVKGCVISDIKNDGINIKGSDVTICRNIISSIDNGIYNESTDCDVYENIVSGCTGVAGIACAAAAVSARIYNNTIQDCLDGIDSNSMTSDACGIYNNVVTGCTSEGLNIKSTHTENYNCLYDNITNSTQTIGSSTIETDPALDAEYFPGPVCIGAGTTPLSNFDFYGRPHTGNGDHIGAVWPKVNTNKNRRKF